MKIRVKKKSTDIPDGSEGNAFQHAYGSALMAYYMGVEQAYDWTTGHEAYAWSKMFQAEEDGFTFYQHTEMDLKNNAYGIDLAISTPKTATEIQKSLLDICGSPDEVEKASLEYGVNGFELLLAIQIKNAISRGELSFIRPW